MDPNTADALSPDLLPAMVESALDLLQIGQLTNAAERFALERAENLRESTDADLALEARVDNSGAFISRAVATARQAVGQRDAFDAGIRAMLKEPGVAKETARSFEAMLDGSNGSYADAALAICDRIERDLAASDDPADPPPVSGGMPSGCDLIALGSMLAGATCIMGCGECCIVGVGGAFIYVAAC